MGVVWAATHAVTRKTVAIKMLKTDKASNPVVRQRFVREARAASAVAHPNIIEIRDVIELDDGAPAMVMDLLRGESLGDRIEREPALPIETLAPIMVQVLSAVGTAHAAGIVHRDLKPDNIFLVAEAGGPSVRVLDFGIAKVMPGGSELPISHGLTNTGAILGTPFYMAPEQIYGERGIDHRADVWAIGVILYECLSGRRPTEAENIGQILRIITNNEIAPLRDLAPQVPADVADLVARMLQPAKAARSASLAEAFEVMKRYAPTAGSVAFSAPSTSSTADTSGPLPALPALPVRAVVPSDSDASPTAATLASTTASITADRVAGLPRRRRARGLQLGLGAFVVAGALVLGFAVRSRPSSPGAPTATAASAPLPQSLPALLPPPPPEVPAPPPPAAPSTPVAASSAPVPRKGATPPAPRASTPAVPTVASPSPASTSDAPPKRDPYDHL